MCTPDEFGDRGFQIQKAHSMPRGGKSKTQLGTLLGNIRL